MLTLNVVNFRKAANFERLTPLTNYMFLFIKALKIQLVWNNNMNLLAKNTVKIIFRPSVNIGLPSSPLFDTVLSLFNVFLNCLKASRVLN